MRSCFRGTERDVTVHLAERLNNPDGPRLKVEAVSAQSGELTPAETRVRRGEYQRSIAAIDGVSEARYLGRREEVHLGVAALPGEVDPDARRAADESVDLGGGQDASERAVRRRHGAGREPIGQLRDPGAYVCRRDRVKRSVAEEREDVLPEPALEVRPGAGS